MALAPEARPHLRQPILIGAFTGLPDSGMGASLAVRHLVAALDAQPLASQESDDYYDYGELRPVSRLTGSQDRVLEWPKGRFWFAHDPRETADARDLVLYLAPEPRLRWRAFAAEIAEAAVEWQVQEAILLASVPADVPHTRETIVTGWASAPAQRVALNRLGVPFSQYEGPASIHSALIEAFRAQRVPSASLFGSAPHYLQIPNPAVAATLLQRVATLTGWVFDMQRLEAAAQQLRTQADEAIGERQELAAYVEQLEARYDESKAPLAPGQVDPSAEAEASSEPLSVDPEELVEELEDFLRRRREQDAGGDEEPPSPTSI